MKINSLLNIASSFYRITKPLINNSVNKIFRIAEKHYIQGKYVTREEFEVAKEQILKLQHKLSEKLKK